MRDYHDEGWIHTLEEVEAHRAVAGEMDPEPSGPTPDEYADKLSARERAVLRKQREEAERNG